MKGIEKRLCTRVLSVLMVCLLTVTAFAAPTENCPGGCAHPAAVGTTHYDTLEEAVAAVHAGGIVTLLADTTLIAPVTIDKSMALDLGGKTLTGNLPAAEQVLLQFTQGGTIRNGKILVSQGSAVGVTDCMLVIEKDAVLEGCGSAPAVSVTASKGKTVLFKVSGSVTGTGSSPVIDVQSAEGNCELYVLEDALITADTNPAIAMNCAGKLEIADGTIQTKGDAITVVIAEDRQTEIAITGGKILSEEGESIVITTEGNAKAPVDFVAGGTFMKVPSAYVPSYGKTQKNEDGTFTVITSYTLTFQANGASGTMNPITVNCGSNVKLPACGFTAPKGMDFAGWKIGSKTYAAGDTYTPTADMTITALWKAHTHSGGKATCQKKADCNVCGESYGKLASHNLKHVAAYEPTCTASGMNSHDKCTVCGKRFVSGIEITARAVTIPALGHSWETVEGIPATCAEAGLQEHQKCADCGIVQVGGKTAKEADLTIPAGDHVLETVAAVEATCKEAGAAAHERCSVCGLLLQNGRAVEADALTIPVVSHVLSDWNCDETSHWKACVDCGDVFRQKAHADSDLDGFCNDCGYSMTKTEEELPAPETSGFNWLFLIPVIAAVAIAVPLALKKRKA